MSNPSIPHCRYCGGKLDVIRQVLPRRTLVLVTCWQSGCKMFEFTLGDQEHPRIARRKFRQARLHGPGRLIVRVKVAPKA